MEKNETKSSELKFSKDILIKAKFYNEDILRAVLEDSKCYSKKEAMDKINKYLKGRVM